MGLRVVGRAVAAAAACSLLWASVAGASTVTVGQLFAPNVACNGSTALQTSVASGTSYTVPAQGVITAWSFEAGATSVSGLKLKVGRSVGGGQYVITGDAAAGAQVPNELNTYPADIPVQAGDLIGLMVSVGRVWRQSTGPTRWSTTSAISLPGAPRPTVLSVETGWMCRRRSRSSRE